MSILNLSRIAKKVAGAVVGLVTGLGLALSMPFWHACTAIMNFSSGKDLIKSQPLRLLTTLVLSPFLLSVCFTIGLGRALCTWPLLVSRQMWIGLKAGSLAALKALPYFYSGGEPNSRKYISYYHDHVHPFQPNLPINPPANHIKASNDALIRKILNCPNRHPQDFSFLKPDEFELYESYIATLPSPQKRLRAAQELSLHRQELAAICPLSRIALTEINQPLNVKATFRIEGQAPLINQTVFDQAALISDIHDHTALERYARNPCFNDLDLVDSEIFTFSRGFHQAMYAFVSKVREVIAHLNLRAGLPLAEPGASSASFYKPASNPNPEGSSPPLSPAPELRGYSP